jgi:hypothetical protein
MSCQALNLKAQGNAVIQAQQISMEASSMVNVKGANIVLQGRVALGSAGGLPALLLTTQFMGIGNLGIPVLSQAIGPFSSKVTMSP